MKKKFKLHNISLLRITLLTGCILLLLFGGILAVIFVDSGGAIARGIKESAFHRLLQDYDFKYSQVPATGDMARRQAFERLDSDLDRMEKRAGGVEAWLSVLKRRRQLSLFDTRYESAYRQSSSRAAAAFPYSEPLAAVAAAALVHNAAITPEGEGYLRKALPLLASSRMAPLRLSLHALMGDFRNPETAAASLPRGNLALPEFFTAPTAETAAVFSDLILLKIIAGEIPSAAIDIQSALVAAAFNAEPSPSLSRLAAEYFYDFGDLLRSAELFSTLPDEEALSRQADALWLAGYIENARNIWKMQTMQNPQSAPFDSSTLRPAQGSRLKERENPFYEPALDTVPDLIPDPVPELVEEVKEAAAYEWVEAAVTSDAVYSRALYNLAVTAPTLEEEAALLERLVTHQSAGETPSYKFGLIRFSRLLDAPGAIAVLEGKKAHADDFLIDLEMLKRRTEIGELARLFAETWLLLDRYPETEDVYEWGVWYFNLQRNFTESGKLLEIAARHNFTGDWAALYGALQHIRDGNLDAAGDILSAAAANGDWAAAANWGRVLESLRAPSRALENYERALAVVMADANQGFGDYAAASRIQVRVALCFKTLGRFDESRRALNYALDLNPDNLTARLELSRL